MSKYEIHPLAALFAEFDEEEMATTVESIRRHGLQHKISVVRGRIVDGVNREKACELAGVEPVYEELSIPEEKIGEFILAQNVARRHMNKGQQAVFVALVHPKPEKGGRGKKSTIPKGFSLAYLSMARELVRLDRARAERVLKDRDYSLDQALRDAKPEPEPERPEPEAEPQSDAIDALLAETHKQREEHGAAYDAAMASESAARMRATMAQARADKKAIGTRVGAILRGDGLGDEHVAQPVADAGDWLEEVNAAVNQEEPHPKRPHPKDDLSPAEAEEYDRVVQTYENLLGDEKAERKARRDSESLGDASEDASENEDKLEDDEQVAERRRRAAEEKAERAAEREALRHGPIHLVPGMGMVNDNVVAHVRELEARNAELEADLSAAQARVQELEEELASEREKLRASNDLGAPTLENLMTAAFKLLSQLHVTANNSQNWPKLASKAAEKRVIALCQSLLACRGAIASSKEDLSKGSAKPVSGRETNLH
jgi:ParB-like chromosome segregation protein Spo0J